MEKLKLEDLKNPLPSEAIKPHPTKTFLSSINSIYVTERLNDVFGVGGWNTKVEHVTDKEFIRKGKNGKPDQDLIMVVVKVELTIPAIGLHLEQYGGNDNEDLGDAYKGATTDALTKLGSYLGIGADIWKGKQEGALKASSTYKKTATPTKKGKTEFYCKVCNKVFENFKDKIHNGKKYKIWECATCKKDSGYPESFWEEIKTPTTPEEYKEQLKDEEDIENLNKISEPVGESSPF